MVEKNWTISRIIEETGMEGASVLSEAGLHCVGCAMARGESLEEGCKAHGFPDEKIDEIVEKLNALKK